MGGSKYLVRRELFFLQQGLEEAPPALAYASTVKRGLWSKGPLYEHASRGYQGSVPYVRTPLQEGVLRKRPLHVPPSPPRSLLSIVCFDCWQFWLFFSFPIDGHVAN